MWRKLSVLAALVAPMVSGCSGGGETKWTAEAARHAVYATQIPIYPGAELDDAIGSEISGETVSEGMTFWFTVDAPKEQVLAWYEDRLVGAVKRTLEDGEIILTLAPRDGEVGEEMGVIVERGRFRIFENTKAGKHRNT